MAKLSLVVALCVLTSGLVAAREYAPVVQIEQGKVRGLVVEVENGEKVNFYQGIRYGRAKRFEKPVPAESWKGVYNATRFQHACPQPGKQLGGVSPPGAETRTMSEDCLYVNVYQPTKSNRTDRAVMVWIHGGTFITGTIFGMAYDSRFLASKGDLVVVTLNYRLGAFGFLYAGESDAPGNMGLHDQILALRWVHDNIHHFGGDPNKVTIFGESAGSMSVGALVLSPLTKGLIRRAILQSGGPNSYLGSNPLSKGIANTHSLAKRLDCTHENISQEVACLRTKSVGTILEACKDDLQNAELMVPVYGEELLPVPPVEALKTGKFNQVDLMFGVTRNEGSGFVVPIIPQLDPNLKNPNMTIDQVKGVIQLFMLMFHEDKYANNVTEYYTKNINQTNQDDLRLAISDVFGDFHLICPTVLYGEQFGKITGPGHHYYSYRLMSPLKRVPLFGCSGWMGVCHAEDIVYLFSLPSLLRGIIFNEDEYHLSRGMIDSWTSFANTGHPGKVNGAEWTEAVDHTHPSVSYMSLEFNQYRMVPDAFKEKCDVFWKPIIFS